MQLVSTSCRLGCREIRRCFRCFSAKDLVDCRCNLPCYEPTDISHILPQYHAIYCSSLSLETGRSHVQAGNEWQRLRPEQYNIMCNPIVFCRASFVRIQRYGMLFFHPFSSSSIESLAVDPLSSAASPQRLLAQAP
jgi:hypothetical protein